MPGAFPTTDEPKDFARKLKLSAEKPVQPIGRSSRNEAKGLFAGPDNGYFDSPVMSREHADIKLLFNPVKKVCSLPRSSSLIAQCMALRESYLHILRAYMYLLFPET